MIILTFAAGVAGTGLGGFFAAFFRRESKKTVSVLLSFAAGVMLSVVCFDLITDALKNSDIILVFLGVMFGFSLVFLLNDLIDRTAIHKKSAKKDGYKGYPSEKLFIGGVVMAVAIALHNLPEGMVIGASYADSNPSDIFKFSELAVAVVIGLHNIPEGMAVAVPLISGGMKRATAVMLTALTGAPTVIGAVIGYLLGTLSPLWLALSLSFASGAMLYVVFGELLPDSALMWNSKLPVFAAIIGVLTGILIIRA